MSADLTPEAEAERALSMKAFELAKPTIERWRQMPYRDAYIESMMVSAAYVAYRAGREDAARDIEATVVAGQRVPEWALPGGVPIAEGLRTWAASIARGDA